MDNYLVHTRWDHGTDTGLQLGNLNITVKGRKLSREELRAYVVEELYKMAAADKATENVELAKQGPGKIEIREKVCECDRSPVMTSHDKRKAAAKVMGDAIDKAMLKLFGASASHMHAPYYDPNPQPLPESGDAGGMKYDAGKPLAGVLFADFPRALKAVVDIGTFGAKKYKRSSWKVVPNAEQRYTDALYRHLLEASITPVDAESDMLHLAHAAWGILAVLELQLQREAGNNGSTVSCEGSK